MKLAIFASQAIAHRNAGESVPGLSYFTPNINIFRDPGWGRGQETPGEDPFLTSHYAAVMVMALQYGREFFVEIQSQDKNGLPKATKPRIAATCKHFAAYSLESGRFNFSADIDQQHWNDTYTPAFQACIYAESFLSNHFGKDVGDRLGAGGLGVMCSYNAINGTPSCANKELLDTLRGDWKFIGYIVSDCWAINNIFEHHKFGKSYQEAAGMALRAGVDLDCGDTVQKYGMKALEYEFMEIDDVNRALTNLFGVLMDVGYFDEKDSRNTKDDRIQTEFQTKVALEAALQSIVLLKNGLDSISPQEIASERSLPLSIAKHKRVTVVGPLADNREASQVITPLQGLKDMGVQVNYIHGCNVTGDLEDLVEELVDKTNCNEFALENDATILILGLDQTIESEDIDRTSLLLPRVQRELVSHATRCSKAISPDALVILVVIAGGPIDTSKYKTSNSIDAMLYTSYPGQAGGLALAHVLYGKYNPSGRLVTTQYPNSYVDTVRLQSMRMRPNKSGFPGRTYRFYNEEAVYPFGFGLSYSSWHYTLELMKAEEVIRVRVSNTGSIDGSTAVLLFHKGPNSDKYGNPVKSLIGFEKVFVPSLGYAFLNFDLQKNVFALSGDHIFVVGPSMKCTLHVNV